MNSPLPADDRTLHIENAVLHRLAGASLEAISMLYGVTKAVVKKRMSRAVYLGYVTAERIRTQKPPHPALSDEDYNRRWLTRVKSRCVVTETGCWVWPGIHGTNGYGQYMYRGRTISLHRQMYKVVHSVQLPRTQYVCHTCDVRDCCNPDHLWLGTASDNQLDASRKGRHQETKRTHCKRGHPFSGANLYVTSYGSRQCLACSRARLRIKLGWPEDLAYSAPPVPAGEFPVGGYRGSKRKAA